MPISAVLIHWDFDPRYLFYLLSTSYLSRYFANGTIAFILWYINNDRYMHFAGLSVWVGIRYVKYKLFYKQVSVKLKSLLEGSMYN